MFNKLISTSILLTLISARVSAQSPGGVTAGLQTWVKANVGVTGATPITGWTNQAPGTAIIVNGSPNLVNNTSYNYNPYVDFTAPVGTLSDGLAANRQFLRLSGFSGISGINYTSLFFVFQLNDLSRINTHCATVENVTTASPANGTLHGDANGAIASILLEAYDIADFGTGSPAGTWQRNGANIASNSDHSSGKHLLSANCLTGGSTTINTFLGGQRDAFNPSFFAGHTRDWRGPVGEIIGYTTTLSVTNRQKIDTYLAVKYGLTLSNNYLSTSGGTIFSVAAPYNMNIIGIGRDDAEALIQKQSHTDDDVVRIYISSITATNVANTGSFTNDISYVIAGANTGNMCATSASNSEVPTGLTNCALFSRLEREWKVTKTNLPQNFNMDFRLASCGAPGSVNTSHLRFLVDDDGNFANGGTQCYYNGDGTGIVISYSNPVITITGISATHIPNNATKYVTIASINALTPLPVELLNFDAQLNNSRQVDLKWETESEINTDHFEIYRSRDLENWEWIQNQPSAGNSSTLVSYETVDLNPFPGLSYYQLKTVDLDGNSSLSEIRVIDLKQTDEITLLPNPATDYLYINGYNLSGTNLQITNTLGQEIHPIILSEDNSGILLSTKELSKGTYFLRLGEVYEGKPMRFIIK